MKLPPRRYLIALGVLLVPLLVFWWSGGLRAGSAPVGLDVLLLAVERDDPMHHRPERSTVLNGITGLSAIFAVTNLSRDASIWFDTCAVEQQVGAEWRHVAVPPYAVRVTDQRRIKASPWIGIASADVNDVYPPGTCWNYVVAWPPDVPTNATWRLQLRYGPQPSPRARKLDDALGLDLFARRRKGELLFTPEVHQ